MNDVEDRLLNWGHAMRDGWRKGHCMSIEHRYLPERIVGESWESRQTAKLMIDHRDAAEVERAWRDISKRLYQQVLQMHYVWRSPPAFTCRRLAIQHSRDNRHYLLELGRAHTAILRLLEPRLGVR
jgi:hypothetical protein